MFAAYELIQLVCPDMIAANSGSIINVSSVASRLPGDGPYPDRSGGVLPGYGGSKAALEHLTWCAAYDLQGHNVAVNALAPSKPIMTPGLSYYARGFDEVAQPEEFAQAALQLTLVDPQAVTGARSVICRCSAAASTRSSRLSRRHRVDDHRVQPVPLRGAESGA